MARDKGTLTNIDKSDLANYPNGRIRNNSGVGDGTPVDEFVYGDIHEFFAKCMRLNGMSFTGIPDNEATGYQYLEAVIALASKNDYLLSLSGSTADALTVPLKLNLVKVGEAFICIAALDRTTETEIIGSLDLSPSNYAVTFKGGDFKSGDYLLVIKTNSGVDIVRMTSATNFETIAEEYGYLLAASQAEEDAGAISTKGTTPLTNFTTFVKRVNGDPESDPYIVTQTHNGLMSKEDKIKLDGLGDDGNANQYGTVLVGDVDAGSVGLNYPVTGDIQAAQLTERTSKGNVITITLTNAMSSSDYMVRQLVQSLGTIQFDNDLKAYIFKIISASQFQVYYEEDASVIQNIKVHYEIIQK
mgnify:CR=1 FL=1